MSAQVATAISTTKGSVPARRQGDADLLTQFDRIQESIARRAFELFEGSGGWFGHELDNWLRAQAEIVRPLPLELKESDDSFTLRAEVPGFAVKDLEISLEPRSLKIAGKRETKDEEKKGKTICSELYADQIVRIVDLPADVDTSKASATLKEGILNIDLPKAAHAKSVRVELKVA